MQTLQQCLHPEHQQRTVRKARLAFTLCKRGEITFLRAPNDGGHTDSEHFKELWCSELILRIFYIKEKGILKSRAFSFSERWHKEKQEKLSTLIPRSYHILLEDHYPPTRDIDYILLHHPNDFPPKFKLWRYFGYKVRDATVTNKWCDEVVKISVCVLWHRKIS